ncbi:MAG: hypothetical protein ACOY3H_05790 [Bacillota bacterium]
MAMENGSNSRQEPAAGLARQTRRGKYIFFSCVKNLPGFLMSNLLYYGRQFPICSAK